MNGGINQSISAGPGGFLAFFLLAIALWFLMRSMSKRLRRVRFEEEAEEVRLAAEAGDDMTVRPRRRQIFLPVDDARATEARGAQARSTQARTPASRNAEDPATR